MKKTYIRNVIIGIFLSFTFISCQIFQSKEIPKVIDPSYSTYNNSGEKGYEVTFGLSQEAEPIFLIINKIKHPISSENKNGLVYKVKVIAETRKIENHKVEGTSEENGIIFRVKGQEVYKPVRFTLK